MRFEPVIQRELRVLRRMSRLCRSEPPIQGASFAHSPAAACEDLVGLGISEGCDVLYYAPLCSAGKDFPAREGDAHYDRHALGDIGGVNREAGESGRRK